MMLTLPHPRNWCAPGALSVSMRFMRLFSPRQIPLTSVLSLMFATWFRDR